MKDSSRMMLIQIKNFIRGFANNVGSSTRTITNNCIRLHCHSSFDDYGKKNMLNKISKNFDRSEFACKGMSCNCQSMAVDKELIDVLEHIRVSMNSPVIINSAYRCPEHNERVGGSINSMHLTGKAADIRVRDFAPEDVQTFLKANYPDSYGIGCYDTFTHIDVRDNKARW